MAIDGYSRLKSSDYDYSDRWTVINNTAKKLMWMSVYEFSVWADVYGRRENIHDKISSEIQEWRKSSHAEWIYDNTVEDVRIETVTQMNQITLEETIKIKIMARFYEEIATFYVLKWK